LPTEPIEISDFTIVKPILSSLPILNWLIPVVYWLNAQLEHNRMFY